MVCYFRLVTVTNLYQSNKFFFVKSTTLFIVYMYVCILQYWGACTKWPFNFLLRSNFELQTHVTFQQENFSMTTSCFKISVRNRECGHCPKLAVFTKKWPILGSKCPVFGHFPYFKLKFTWQNRRQSSIRSLKFTHFASLKSNHTPTGHISLIFPFMVQIEHPGTVA